MTHVPNPMAKPKPSLSAKSGASKPPAKVGKNSRGGGGHPVLRVIKWLAILGFLAAGVGAAVLAVMFWYFGADPKLPKLGSFADYQPKQVTRVVDAKGRLIGEIYEERRTVVPLAQVAPVMIQAMTSAEDKHFFEHGGIDLIGIVRAMWVNVTHGETKQGASTITQQVVKTMLLSPERTLRRKVQEIILARRLEKALSKDEILTVYLNQISFGHRRFGVEEAARYFFGKHASEVDVGEAALLAGLAQAPERLSPRRNPEAAKQRQVEILRRMARNGHLSDADAQRWIDAPIRLIDDPDGTPSAAPEVLDLARAELIERYGEAKLATLGLTVRTSIDLDLQRAARAALRDGLAAVDARHGYTKVTKRVAGDKIARELEVWGKKRGDRVPKPTEVSLALVTKVDDDAREAVVDLGGWAAVLPLPESGRFVPAGQPPSSALARGDVIKVRIVKIGAVGKRDDVHGVAELAQQPDGVVVVIEPQSRQVLALVGGASYRSGDFNRATRAKRQPGSSFKPFVFAAALDAKLVTAATILNDAPEVYELWKPKNYESGKFLGPVRLRTALALSINTVAIKVLSMVGADKVVELAHAMGIASDLPREMSLALGSGEVTPIELVNAFATFAAGGQAAPWRVIVQIGDEVVPAAEVKQVLRPEVAYLVTDLMRSVVDEGTATAAKKLKRQIAGKTGTSNAARDTWFVGYTPDLVCGVWLGFDDNRPLGRGETGGHAALPIWIEVMRTALKPRGAKTFKPPAGVVTARIDLASGKLAPQGALEGGVRDEVFLDGTAPTEIAPAAGEAAPDTFILDQLDSDDREPPDMTPPRTDGDPSPRRGRDGDDDTAGASDVAVP